MKDGPQLPGLGRYMALGFQMVIVTALFAGIGYWLDKKFGTEPWLLVVFFFVGAAAGIVTVWRAFNEDSKKPR